MDTQTKTGPAAKKQPPHAAPTAEEAARILTKTEAERKKARKQRQKEELEDLADDEFIAPGRGIYGEIVYRKYKNKVEGLDQLEDAVKGYDALALKVIDKGEEVLRLLRGVLSGEIDPDDVPDLDTLKFDDLKRELTSLEIMSRFNNYVQNHWKPEEPSST